MEKDGLITFDEALRKFAEEAIVRIHEGTVDGDTGTIQEKVRKKIEEAFLGKKHQKNPFPSPNKKAWSANGNLGIICLFDGNQKLATFSIAIDQCSMATRAEIEEAGVSLKGISPEEQKAIFRKFSKPHARFQVTTYWKTPGKNEDQDD